MPLIPSAARSYKFSVPGVPVAQPRQRHTIRNGHVHNYTPADSPVNTFKATARLAARGCFRQPLEGAVRLFVVFVLPRPGRLRWKTRAMPRQPHTSKPDKDNLEKALMDALKGIAWVDDSQVYYSVVTKWVAAGDEAPHTELEIKPY